MDKPRVTWRPAGATFRGSGIDVHGFIVTFTLGPNYPTRVPDVETAILQELDGSAFQWRHNQALVDGFRQVVEKYLAAAQDV